MGECDSVAAFVSYSMVWTDQSSGVVIGPLVGLQAEWAAANHVGNGVKEITSPT